VFELIDWKVGILRDGDKIGGSMNTAFITQLTELSVVRVLAGANSLVVYGNRRKPLQVPCSYTRDRLGGA
jgi:hypothetical protein